MADAQVLPEITYAEAAELAYAGAKVLHPRTLAPLVQKKIPVWSKNSFAPEKPGTKIVPAITTAMGARAVASMGNVALVALEPAGPELNGVQVMARALDAVARANVEVLLVSSSSYRQNFCFLVRQDELEKSVAAIESALALEFAHLYLKPISVDRDVGLLAAVGEGMQGRPGLAGVDRRGDLHLDYQAVPLDSGGRLRINYVGPPGTIETVSYRLSVSSR